jgi:hypothetical protein
LKVAVFEKILLARQVFLFAHALSTITFARIVERVLEVVLTYLTWMVALERHYNNKIIRFLCSTYRDHI